MGTKFIEKPIESFKRKTIDSDSKQKKKINTIYRRNGWLGTLEGELEHQNNNIILNIYYMKPIANYLVLL